MVWVSDIEEEPGTDCPVRLGHDHEFYFRSRRWRDKGFLPLPGTWFDQPAHWVQALDIIDAVSAHVEAEQLRDIKHGARDR